MLMPKVSENAVVAAPADKIYKLLSEPERAVMFVPGLSRITNVSPDKRSWDYEFSWHGLSVSGHAECTAAESPKKYQFKTITGNPSTWTYQCASDGGKSKLSLEIEFDVPKNQIVRFASEAILHTMNQNTARQIVSHIKTLMEG
jgi:ribosome-associated toxin RatA of RatAB toxin-antitoxin module